MRERRRAQRDGEEDYGGRGAHRRQRRADCRGEEMRDAEAAHSRVRYEATSRRYDESC